MSSVVLIAIITTAGTAIVAAAGAIGTIFGPTWRDSRARAAERKEARDDARYERAEALIQAARHQAFGVMGAGEMGVSAARTAFIATLRPGEGEVAQWLSSELRALASGLNNDTSAVVSYFSDDLLAYLRGDLSVAELTASGSWSRRAPKSDEGADE